MKARKYILYSVRCPDDTFTTRMLGHAVAVRLQQQTEYTEGLPAYVFAQTITPLRTKARERKLVA